jgi:hypothetical protein
MTATTIAATARPLAVRVNSPAVATGDRPRARKRSASGSKRGGHDRRPGRTE